MMDYILFDDHTRFELFPFTHTRPIADIRCGILTMRKRWEYFLQISTATLTAAYLQPLFPGHRGGDCLLINAAVFADEALTVAVKALQKGQVLVQESVVIAACTTASSLSFDTLNAHLQSLSPQVYTGNLQKLERVTDIFSLNDTTIRSDYAMLTHGRISAPVSAKIIVAGNNLFLEEGAVIHAGAVINTDTGPVYLGKDAEIMEGCLVRGPLALGTHAVLKMGAKVYGATTIGDGCKVGGEVNNVVFFANSNKGHDGFLGNAVIGEWCNLGADTNCSNLKNNYDEVKLWHEHSSKSVRTGLQFCGLLMGDHSKCAINTMFNTGTIVGVSVNIFGAGFPEKFVPSFCWGGSEQMVTYDFEKAIHTAGRMMIRRGKTLSDTEKEVLRYLFEHTAQQRYLFAHE